MRARKHGTALALLTLVGPALTLVSCEALDSLNKQKDAEIAAGAFAAYLGCTSFPTFEAEAQDILMDRCFSCHQTESGFLLNKRDSGFNYAQTLEELVENDFGYPLLNPLLIKATGGDGHVGGEILRQIDDDFAVLVEWIAEERATPCPAHDPDDVEGE